MTSPRQSLPAARRAERSRRGGSSQLPADISAQLTALLDGDLMTASAADIERQGRAR